MDELLWQVKLTQLLATLELTVSDVCWTDVGWAAEARPDDEVMAAQECSRHASYSMFKFSVLRFVFEIVPL